MKKLLLSLFALSTIGTMAQWTDQTSGVTNDLNDVFFTDNSTGWTVGRQGTILRTTNGGQTWSPQNSATTEDLNAVFMVSSSVGYAVGNKGKVSKYNGTTWTAANTSQTRDIFGVYFLDANTGWGVGDWGRLWYTTNGGSSWTNQNNDALASYKYNDVHMVDANNGWAVGTSGRIVKYNGSSWSSQTSGVTDELLGVHFLNANFGFAVGTGSTILFYDGNTWSPHNSGLGNTSDNIYDVHIISQTEAYAVVSPGFGGAGIILKYNGNTWSKNYEYTGIGTELFYGLHFPTSSKGYVVGVGGMIKTMGSGVGVDKNQILAGVEAYPNPCNEFTTIRFELNAPQPVSCSVCDVTGKEVIEMPGGNYGSGNNNMIIETKILQPGIYFYKLRTQEQVFSGKITIQ